MGLVSSWTQDLALFPEGKAFLRVLGALFQVPDPPLSLPTPPDWSSVVSAVWMWLSNHRWDTVMRF